MPLNPPAPAVLFDLDGTLVDSLPDLLWALNQLLGELGLRQARLDEVQGWVGDGVAMLVERALAATRGRGEVGLDEGVLQQAIAKFTAYYQSHVAVESRLYPGVRAMLDQLRAQGYKLAVCTNKPTALAQELLATLGVALYFTAVIGGDAVSRRKPHGEHIAATLAALGTEARHSVMVGDSANDVAAARAAGIPVLVVSFGYFSGPAQDLKADGVIENFSQLLQALGALLA